MVFINNKFINIVLGIVVGFCNGMFGSGGGSVLVPALEKFLNFEKHKAHATAIFIILPISIVSTFIYLNNIQTNFLQISLIIAGGLIGGYLGAKLLKKIPTRALHIIFGSFMILASWRMIL